MKEIVIDATVENLPQVLEFIDTELEGAECKMKDQLKIDMAVEELYVNIAHYAYRNEIGKAEIKFDIDEKNRVVITLIDSGVHYDPLAKEDPDVTLSAEERKIGGLGIYMVKNSMDDVLYEYVDGKNKTTIIKNL